MKIVNALTAGDKPHPHGASAMPIYGRPHAVAVHVAFRAGQSLKERVLVVKVPKPTETTKIL
jgi:hypothetical protein